MASFFHALRWTGLFAAVAVFGCAPTHPASQAADAAQPRVSAGETAKPLPLVTAGAVAIEGHAEDPRSSLALPEGRLVGGGPDTLFLSSRDEPRGRAFDVARGADRWRISGVSLDHAVVIGDVAYLSETKRLPGNDFASLMTAYDLRIGRQLQSRTGYEATPLNGSLYVSSRQGLTAYRLRDLREMWSTSYQGAFNVEQMSQHGDVLFVGSSGSGAISITETLAIDVRTGRIRYTSGSGSPQPLGFGDGRVYLDSTWPPDVMENYAPITITTRDTETGAVIGRQHYAPDPQIHGNAKGEPNAFRPVPATNVHVAGGYVYMTVDTDGYRYRADLEPAAADLRRMPDVHVAATLENGQLLVTTADSVSLANAFPDRLEIHALGSGVLRKAGDDVAGRRLLVVGPTLLRLDDDGHVRALGRVTCSNVTNVFAWNGGAAVECGTDNASVGNRVLVYNDIPITPTMKAPTPAPSPVPAVRFSFTGMAFPTPTPQSSEFPQQQGFGPIAPTRDGGAIVAVHRVVSRTPQTILMRVDAHGDMRTISLPPDAVPDGPAALVVDASDRIWYTDRQQPTLIRSFREREGVRAFELGGGLATATPMPTIVPTPAPPGSPLHRMPAMARRFSTGPLRIALGPDGNVWFARNHPSPEIGRVDGGRHYAIPPQMGNADLLIGDTHALWFAGDTGVGRMTVDGRFTFVASATRYSSRSLSRRVFTTGSNGSVWLAAGNALAQFDATHLLRSVILPNESDDIETAAPMCDGSLIVGEDGAEVARIDAHGAVNYATEGIGYFSDMVRGSDCRIWYVARNAPAGHEIGTLTATPFSHAAKR